MLSNGKGKIYIEIVCKRQSIDQRFFQKLDDKMMAFVEGRDFFIILAPQRLHYHFKGIETDYRNLLYMANSKTITDLLQQLSGKALQGEITDNKLSYTRAMCQSTLVSDDKQAVPA